MGLRDRREDRREDRRDERQAFGVRGDATSYRMREKLVSIGDDFWIEDDRGNRVFKVDGKAMRLRKTMKFEDAHGRELCRIQERVMRVRDSMEIEDPDGKRIAMVHQAMITPLRERWTVDVEGGEDLDVQGNLVDHEYSLDAGGRKVAEVSKRWFRVADTYGVQVLPGQNDVLILAVTAALDSMAHPGK